ncbi:MAG: hypothetical protein ACI9R3_003876 [Verrucomicrobiales bacterium]|jgi:hypothetical protein
MKKRFFATLTGLAGLAAVGSAQAATLIAHFPLDSDGNSAGGTYAASTTNNVTFGTAGANANTGTSATFNGTDSLIQHDWNAGLNPQNFTLSLWSKSSGGAGGFQSPITSRNDKNPDSQGFVLYDANDGNLQFWSGNGALEGNWQVVTGAAVALGEWQHVAITYDHATTTKSLYVDGVLSVEQVASIEPNDTTPFNIGSGEDFGTGFRFNGDLDDIGLWDAALTETQIQAVMTQGVAAAVVPEPSVAGLLALSVGSLLFRRRR